MKAQDAAKPQNRINDKGGTLVTVLSIALGVLVYLSQNIGVVTETLASIGIPDATISVIAGVITLSGLIYAGVTQQLAAVVFLMLLPVAAAAQPAPCLELDTVQVSGSGSWALPGDTVTLISSAGDSARVYLGTGASRVWVCKTAAQGTWVQTGHFGIFETTDPAVIADLAMISFDPTSEFHVSVYDHPLRYVARFVIADRDGEDGLRFAGL